MVCTKLGSGVIGRAAAAVDALATGGVAGGVGASNEGSGLGWAAAVATGGGAATPAAGGVAAGMASLPPIASFAASIRPRAVFIRTSLVELIASLTCCGIGIASAGGVTGAAPAAAGDGLTGVVAVADAAAAGGTVGAEPAATVLPVSDDAACAAAGAPA